jgi:predicted nuclease of predicted toxin-antitoxin system
VEPRFLIDEKLSPQLARHLRYSLGFDAIHVNEIGLNGMSDTEVLTRAIAERRIVVTSNGEDFRRLGRRRQGHPGLAVLLRTVGRHQQIELGEILANAIDIEMVRGAPPDGRLFEIDAAGIVRDCSLP